MPKELVMKLLNCVHCDYIVSLSEDIRTCFCGRSSGRYTNEVNVEFCGPARILGIPNTDYKGAIPGQDCRWIVIPDGHNTTRVNSLDLEERIIRYFKKKLNLPM